MAQITRSTKIGGGTTLSSNTLARAADVETDVLNLFNAHNNHDSGTSVWAVVNGTLVEVANGTAPLPSLTFVNDPDTGLYRDAANTVGLTAGGTKRFSVSDTAAALTVPLTTAGIVNAGTTINAGTQKVTNVVAGTASTDAANFSQLKYIQCITATTTTVTTTTSNGFVATNLTATINLTSASNRVKITVSGSLELGTTGATGFVTLYNNASANLVTSAGFADFLNNESATSRVPVSFVYVDSPATTGNYTYTVRIRNGDNTTTTKFPSGNQPTAVITLEEIV